MSIFSNQMVEVDPHKKIIYLPKMCNYLLSDYSTAKKTLSIGDVLRALTSYMHAEERETVLNMVDSSNYPALKLQPLSFTSRKFTLLEEDEDMNDLHDRE